jgi:hypothetical protein
MRGVSLALVLALVDCSAVRRDCPPTVETEEPLAVADDGGQAAPDAGADGGVDCVSACGIYVETCSASHVCSWGTGTCVTCTFANRCS